MYVYTVLCPTDTCFQSTPCLYHVLVIAIDVVAALVKALKSRRSSSRQALGQRPTGLAVEAHRGTATPSLGRLGSTSIEWAVQKLALSRQEGLLQQLRPTSCFDCHAHSAVCISEETFGCKT